MVNSTYVLPQSKLDCHDDVTHEPPNSAGRPEHTKRDCGWDSTAPPCSPPPAPALTSVGFRARKMAQTQSVLVAWQLLGYENHPPSETHAGSMETFSHLPPEMKAQDSDFQFCVELPPTSFVLFSSDRISLKKKKKDMNYFLPCVYEVTIHLSLSSPCKVPRHT